MIDPTKQLGLNGETSVGKYIRLNVFSKVCSVKLYLYENDCEDFTHKLTNLSRFACAKYLRNRHVPHIQNCNGLQSVVDLKLSDCYKLTDVSALSNCPSLKKIEISCCHSLTDINCLTHIAHMTLSFCPISNQGIAVLGTSLKSLELYRVNEITNVDHIHSLEQLMLQSCDNFMYISGLQQLKNVSVQWCNRFQYYSDLPSLSKLRVLSCPKFHFNYSNTLQMKTVLLITSSLVNMNSFLTFQSLEVLMLSLDYKQSIDVTPLAALPHLKKLELSRIIHRDFNIHLFQQVSWLSVSRAVHCYGITEPMPNLRVLQLTSCDQLTTVSGLKMNRNMKLLFMGCPALLPDMNLYHILLEVADYIVLDMYKSEIEKAAPLLPIRRFPKRKPAIRDKYVEFQGYVPYRGKLLEHLLENVRYLKLHAMGDDYTDLSSLSAVGIHKVPILYLSQFFELRQCYPEDVKPEHQRIIVDSCFEFNNLTSISYVPRVSIGSHNHEAIDLKTLRNCERVDYSFSSDEDINDRKYVAIKDRLYRWKEEPKEEIDLHTVFSIENQYLNSYKFAYGLLAI